MNKTYIDTVRLLLQVAPLVFKSPHFALKGGTALNLFVQDLPRLSVDLDVVFLDHTMPRDMALTTIAQDLGTAKTAIERLGHRVQLRPTRAGEDAKMFVSGMDTEVKVEVNFNFRGTTMPVERRALTSATQEFFSANVNLPVLATPELYGGKLVAAMDRQHPRDIFDVQRMRESFGMPENFVDCFVAYLSGHNRPIHEVLFANPKPLAELFTNAFEGMTTKAISLESLTSTQDWLIKELPRALTATHRQYLLSLARATPDWSACPFQHLGELPAIQWKLLNLRKLEKRNPGLFAKQHDELVERFAGLA